MEKYRDPDFKLLMLLHEMFATPHGKKEKPSKNEALKMEKGKLQARN